MPIIWKTTKINIQDYYKIIRNIVMFNADDGTDMSGLKFWERFKKEWTVNVIPLTEADAYKQYYGHVEGTMSSGIAWGVTGQNVMYLFINDSRDPRITMQNIPPIGHELLHAIYLSTVGTTYVRRKYTAPEGRAGTMGSASTVIVHDNWYGTKEMIKFWVMLGLLYIPITSPYIPIKKAKILYGL